MCSSLSAISNRCSQRLSRIVGGTASKTNVLVCNPQWISAVDYLEICGIIVGQILVGILGDW